MPPLLSSVKFRTTDLDFPWSSEGDGTGESSEALLGPARIGFVHDWLPIYAGAERVLEQMIHVFPESAIYSLIDALPDNQRGFLQGHTVETSFIQRLPFSERFYIEARSSDQRSIRWLRRYREGGPGADPFFESRSEDLFTERTRYPHLADGDILALETESKSRFTWRNVTRVVGTVATLLNTYLIFDRIRQ